MYHKHSSCPATKPKLNATADLMEACIVLLPCVILLYTRVLSLPGMFVLETGHGNS